MRLKGQISIVRCNTGDRTLVSIEVTDGLSGCRLLDVEMNPQDFGLALLGQGFMPCEFDFHEKCPVGKQHEHKQEDVFVPEHPYKDREAAAAKALKPHEVDGWQGSTQDCYNGHRHVRIRELGPKGEEGGGWYQVTFRRYVDVKASQETPKRKGDGR
jgi:hypothetical protein